jgi:HKD family nuclease
MGDQRGVSVLVIQDPTNVHSSHLLDSILEALDGAESVGGAFAYASASGIGLVADDEKFRSVARSHPIDIVVGVDAITTCRALDRLASLIAEYPKVTARAFLNPLPNALFHPKISWFRHPTGGRLIAGSGNLTEGGLLGNWEAYSIESLTMNEMSNVEAVWSNWKASQASVLLPIDNEMVRERARGNHVMAREGDLPTLVAPRPSGSASGAATPVPPVPDVSAVLIAEIPRSGNRWKQANFHKDDYDNFFGAKDGRVVLFSHVNSDGTIEGFERDRPPVTVRSRNFRFELAAASNLAYPVDGRPIGVFVRVAPRTFRYHLLLPPFDGYDVVQGLLQQKVGAEGARMRSVRMSINELRREWPGAPFWRSPVN